MYVDLKKKVVAVEAKDGQTLDGKAITAEIVDAGYDVIKLETVSQSVAEIKAEMRRAAAMSADGVANRAAACGASVLSLFASSSTLVCCALPALLVALGAGAALSSLVSVFPQVVWLSEHKEGAVRIRRSGDGGQWRAAVAQPQRAVPHRPGAAASLPANAQSLRRVYGVSVVVYLIGGWFAFVLPSLA